MSFGIVQESLLVKDEDGEFGLEPKIEEVVEGRKIGRINNEEMVEYFKRRIEGLETLLKAMQQEMNDTKSKNESLEDTNMSQKIELALHKSFQRKQMKKYKGKVAELSASEAEVECLKLKNRGQRRSISSLRKQVESLQKLNNATKMRNSVANQENNSGVFIIPTSRPPKIPILRDLTVVLSRLQLPNEQKPISSASSDICVSTRKSHVQLPNEQKPISSASSNICVSTRRSHVQLPNEQKPISSASSDICVSTRRSRIQLPNEQKPINSASSDIYISTKRSRVQLPNKQKPINSASSDIYIRTRRSRVQLPNEQKPINSTSSDKRVSTRRSRVLVEGDQLSVISFGKDNEVICRLCGRQFSSNRALQGHQAYCKRLNDQNVKQKMNLSIEVPLTATCEECGKSFVSKRGLGVHKRVHKATSSNITVQEIVGTDSLNGISSISGDPMICDEASLQSCSTTFACGICRRKFRDCTNYEHHMQQHRLKEKTFECELCSVPCHNKEDLEKHMQDHTNKKQCYCNTCGEQFSTLLRLKSHTCKSIGCTECRKTFSNKNELRTHMKDHGSITCYLCDKIFKSDAFLKFHRKEIHGLDH